MHLGALGSYYLLPSFVTRIWVIEHPPATHGQLVLKSQVGWVYNHSSDAFFISRFLRKQGLCECTAYHFFSSLSQMALRKFSSLLQRDRSFKVYCHH